MLAAGRPRRRGASDRQGGPAAGLAANLGAAGRATAGGKHHTAINTLYYMHKINKKSITP